MKEGLGRLHGQRLFLWLSAGMMLLSLGMAALTLLPYRELPPEGAVLSVDGERFKVYGRMDEPPDGQAYAPPVASQDENVPSWKSIAKSTFSVAKVKIVDAVDVAKEDGTSFCLARVQVEMVLAQRTESRLKYHDILAVLLPGGSCRIAKGGYLQPIAPGDRYVLLLQRASDSRNSLYTALRRGTSKDMIALGDDYFCICYPAEDPFYPKLENFRKVFPIEARDDFGWNYGDLADYFEKILKENEYLP
jgi:hypothetical protein